MMWTDKARIGKAAMMGVAPKVEVVASEPVKTVMAIVKGMSDEELQAVADQVDLLRRTRGIPLQLRVSVGDVALAGLMPRAFLAERIIKTEGPGERWGRNVSLLNGVPELRREAVSHARNSGMEDMRAVWDRIADNMAEAGRACREAGEAVETELAHTEGDE